MGIKALVRGRALQGEGGRRALGAGDATPVESALRPSLSLFATPSAVCSVPPSCLLPVALFTEVSICPPRLRAQS